MRIDQKIEKLIEAVKKNELPPNVHRLENTHFGIYVPSYTDGDQIAPMAQGDSYLETGLRMIVKKPGDQLPSGAETVAWFGSLQEASNDCLHPGTGPKTCSAHCDGHGGPKVNCTGHENKAGHDEVGYPPLDYDSAIKELEDFEDLVGELAKKGLGISLLHAHSRRHKFTELPEGVVSVVSGGRTSFRKMEDVLADSTFVPNTWRIRDGSAEIAGGFSSV